MILWKRFFRHWRGPRLRVRSEMQRNLAKALLWLAAIVFLHVVAMVQLEGLATDDALWLTLTTATTVGYGDISPSTPVGRLVTVILLYGGGIFILGKFAGDYFEFRRHQYDSKIRGEWRWKMREHILILNAPVNHGKQYFERLVRRFRVTEQYCDHPIQILTTEFTSGLPQSLRDMNVVHYHGRPADPQALKAVSAQEADIIVVLATHEGNAASDGVAFDILHRLGELGTRGKILAECVDDRNRQRLLSAGADAVMRPIRAYPAMIIRAFIAPGAEQIIENLFNDEGDEYKRYDIKLRLRWDQIVSKLVNSDIGIPVAYISARDQRVVSNPRPATEINAQGLLIMVREGNRVTADRIREALAITQA